MLNLVLAGVVCICCITVGWWQRLRYRKRADVMGDLVAFLAYAEEQIQYSLTPLPSICTGFCALHPRSALANALVGYPDLRAVVGMDKKTWGQVADLVLSLGRSDAEGQRGCMAYAKAQADAMCATARDQLRGKGNLYAKLWGMLGLGLLIWMV